MKTKVIFPEEYVNTSIDYLTLELNKCNEIYRLRHLNGASECTLNDIILRKNLILTRIEHLKKNKEKFIFPKNIF